MNDDNKKNKKSKKDDYIVVTTNGVKINLGGPHIGIGQERYMSYDEVADIIDKTDFTKAIKPKSTLSGATLPDGGRIGIDFTK
jgi:hypothetical protein